MTPLREYKRIQNNAKLMNAVYYFILFLYHTKGMTKAKICKKIHSSMFNFVCKLFLIRIVKKKMVRAR